MPARVTDKALSKRYGAALRVLRKKAGFSADEVAKKCGLKSDNTVFGWEAGSGGLTIDTIGVLCELYGLSIEEFFISSYEDPWYTSDEIELINMYRLLTDEGKRLARATMRAYSKIDNIAIDSGNVEVSGDGNAIINIGDNNTVDANGASITVVNGSGNRIG